MFNMGTQHDVDRAVVSIVAPAALVDVIVISVATQPFGQRFPLRGCDARRL
jgi:hypothetical protein